MNTLYPIFLKTENFNILIVGGGFVGTEKLSFILKNSPNANITVVAKEISDEIKSMVNGQLSVDVSDLATGLYFVQMRTATGMITKSIVICR